jgi:hypothetical protein
LPNTLAEPTVVPPDVHDTGGAARGPNTVNVTVPVGADPPASPAEIEAGEIGLPAVALAGALADIVGPAGAALKSRPSAWPELSE